MTQATHAIYLGNLVDQHLLREQYLILLKQKILLEQKSVITYYKNY